MTNSRLQKIAKRSREDFLFFATEILGYKDLRAIPHQEVCDILERPGKRKKLFLLPRGSFKSSLITVAYAIWSMIKNPNVRILVSCETQINSKKYVGEIKEHLEKNAKFKAIFGDWVSEDKAWRESEFTISKRSKVLKEPTVMAASLEKMTVTGMHFDIIICDDVVSRLNVNTQEQIEKTIEHYKLLLSILDPQPDKRIVIVGTRWSIHDLYGWILDPDGEELSQFDVCIKKAIQDDGTLLLPDRLTYEFLEEQKKTQGAYVYNCQYLNTAISSDNQTFQSHWVKTYEQSPKGLIYFMTLDLAISQKDTADYTALIVNGVDWRHNWFIQEAIQKRMEPSETIDLIFQMAEIYQPMMCLAMERFALEKMLKIALLEEMQKRGKFIPIKEIETDTRISKEVRIRSLQPRFQNGQVYLKEEHKALYDQIVMHPQVKHDDLLDALKSQNTITFPSDQIIKEEETKYQNIPYKDRKIWEQGDQRVRRMVRRTRMEDY